MSKELYEHAVAISERAYAPYSKYLVGAAVRTRDGKVFEGVMRGPHRTIGETATYRNDFHIGVVVANIVADLLQAPHRREIGDRVGKCNLAAEGHSGGHAGHVTIAETPHEEFDQAAR